MRLIKLTEVKRLQTRNLKMQVTNTRKVYEERYFEMLYIFLYVLMQRKRKEDIAKEKEVLDIVLERIGG